MATTYILYSQTLDHYYVGSTALDMETRLNKHLTEHRGYTAKSKDWRIEFERNFNTIEEAYAFERQIKKWKSRRAIENLIKGS